MKTAPFKIGSKLLHRPTNTIIVLKRYGTQLVLGYSMSIGGGTTKSKPNYNYLYGEIIDTEKTFEGLTKEFKQVE